MTQSLIPFEEVLRQIEGHKNRNGNPNKKCLLLGNGFSMAYNAKRFSFTNLLETALKEGIIEPNSNIHKVFQKLNTADFEKVIKYLDGVKELISIYQPDFQNDQIEDDIKNIKKHLVNTITNNHPEKSTELLDNESKSCSAFLSNFDKIYSLNYDLLAYWVIMQNSLLNFTDGFGDNAEDNGYDSEIYGDDYDSYLDDYVVYKDVSSHNMMFLHGGLHLYDHNTDAIKITFCRTGKTLKRQIYENLIRGVYPIFISEGSSGEKLEKIRHNYYLNHCYKSFSSQPGDLVIFGTALKSNDSHIAKTIVEGKWDNVYAGVFSNEDMVSLDLLKDRIHQFNKENPRTKQTNFIKYDARTVNPWKSN